MSEYLENKKNMTKKFIKKIMDTKYINETSLKNSDTKKNDFKRTLTTEKTDKIENETKIYYDEMQNSRYLLFEILEEIKSLFIEAKNSYIQKDIMKEKLGEYCKINNNKINLKLISSKNLKSRKLILQVKSKKDKKKEKKRKLEKIIILEKKEKYKKFIENKINIIKKKIETSKIIFYKEFSENIDQITNEILLNYKINKINLFRRYHKIMTRKIKRFKKMKILDLNFLIKNWEDISQKTDKFPRYPLQPRLFNKILAYKQVPEIVDTNYEEIEDDFENFESDKNCNIFLKEKNEVKKEKEVFIKEKNEMEIYKSEVFIKEKNGKEIYKNEIFIKETKSKEIYQKTEKEIYKKNPKKEEKNKIEKSEKGSPKKNYKKEKNDYLKELLKSDLIPNCKENCSCSFIKKNKENFCESVIYKSTWKSDCLDKKKKIECDENCGCPKNCLNKSLQNLKKNPGICKIKTQIVWGIDVYTRKNIFYLLPNNLSVFEKNEIVDKIVKNMNFTDIEGWNLTMILEMLIKETKMYLLDKNNLSSKNEFLSSTSQKIDYTNSFEEFINNHPLKNEIKNPPKSQNTSTEEQSYKNIKIKKKTSEIQKLKKELEAFIVLLKYTKIGQLRKSLRIHSKGLGVICQNPKGIKKNELISEYLGEVYPPWYWNNKQNAIRNFLAKIKKSTNKKFLEYKNNYKVEFYNIMVEKEINEKHGREIFIVDPIINGNFASRLSHSCNPNCWAIPVISKKSYSIALYAIRDINYMEELTFDYCSLTESEKEFKNSICLCGDKDCKIYYLGYTKKMEEYFKNDKECILLDNKENFFLRNNKILLKSCMSSFNQEKSDFLKINSFGKNTYKDSPNWLKNWIFFTLKEIDKEKNMLMEKFKNNSKIQFEIENLNLQRINNLIISIDKIRHFCSKQKKINIEENPPIKRINTNEIITFYTKILKYYTDNELSKEAEFSKIILNIFVNQYTPEIEELIKDFPTNDEKYKLIIYKYIFLKLSDIFKKKNNFHYSFVSDILYFRAFTIVHFKASDYKKYEFNINIRKCDLNNPLKNLIHNKKSINEQKKDLEKSLSKITRKIGEEFIWGEMVFWSNQSIDKPDSMLKSSRKGCLFYPKISNLFFKETRNSKNCLYNQKSRNVWLKQIKERPGKNWVRSVDWKFKNDFKIYGTFLFDDEFFGANNKDKIIKCIDKSNNDRLDLFKKFWKKSFKLL